MHYRGKFKMFKTDGFFTDETFKWIGDPDGIIIQLVVGAGGAHGF